MHLLVGIKFLEEPQNQTVVNGSSVTLNCTADGSDPISYQWFKDGSPIQGENRDTLVFDPVMYNDYGVYHCVVNNSVNTILMQNIITGTYILILNVSCTQ